MSCTGFRVSVRQVTHEVACLLVTLVLTGLRIGENCEPQPEDVDPGARAVRVRDAKTRSGVRVIYVAEEFWYWLSAGSLDRGGRPAWASGVSVTEIQRPRGYSKKRAPRRSPEAYRILPSFRLPGPQCAASESNRQPSD